MILDLATVETHTNQKGNWARTSSNDSQYLFPGERCAPTNSLEKARILVRFAAAAVVLRLCAFIEDSLATQFLKSVVVREEMCFL